MTRRSLILMAAAGGAAVISRAQAAMKTSDVLDMLQAGVPEDVVIAKLHKANQPFDLSAQEIVQLKKSGVSDNLIKVMIDPSAAVTATAPVVNIGGVLGGKASGATPTACTSHAAIDKDMNNPDAPHDSGIYLFADRNNQKTMTMLERAAYRGTKGNFLGHSMTYGILKAKVRAVIPGWRATLRTSDLRPTFYFYFEEKSAGLGKSGFGAMGGQTVSNPNQFGLCAWK